MNLIALVDRNWAIGLNGQQIIYIPEDLKRFKSLTKGKAVILGRKTLYTFPNGQPLKERRNLILSKNKGLNIDGAEVFKSIEELMANAPKECFVIGGETVYREMLKFCDKAYITYLDAEFEADSFLTDLDKEADWKILNESDTMEYKDIKYTFRLYERIQPFECLTD